MKTNQAKEKLVAGGYTPAQAAAILKSLEIRKEKKQNEK